MSSSSSLSNAHFEAYYRHQLGERTFQSVLQTLRNPLPLTFRLTRNGHESASAHALKRLLDESGKRVLRCTQIGFLDDARTYQIDGIRVNDEDLKTKQPNLHQFLVRMNEGGDLSRYVVHVFNTLLFVRSRIASTSQKAGGVACTTDAFTFSRNNTF
jgi:hypothetical protein